MPNTKTERRGIYRSIAIMRPAVILAVSLLGFIFVAVLLYNDMLIHGPQNPHNNALASKLLLGALLVGLVVQMVAEVVGLFPLHKEPKA